MEKNKNISLVIRSLWKFFDHSLLYDWDRRDDKNYDEIIWSTSFSSQKRIQQENEHVLIENDKAEELLQ